MIAIRKMLVSDMKQATDFQESKDDSLNSNSLSGEELPHLAITVFCVEDETEKVVKTVIEDRRMVNVTSSIVKGSLDDAVNLYQKQTTPNLLIIEDNSVSAEFISKLDELADVCDPETRVVVIGKNNDIKLYRRLIDKGIEDYLLAPISTKSLLTLLQSIYCGNNDGISGRVIAFIGARGGSGSSVLAQDSATTIATRTKRPTILIDFDIHFGSAALNLDVEYSAGTKNYLEMPDTFDTEIFNRVISKRGKYLSVFCGPEDSFSSSSMSPEVAKKIIRIARKNFSYIILDLPSTWDELTRNAILIADDILVVATPELVSLRNTRRIFEVFKSLRPNDVAPTLILNTCSMPKRKELSVKKFADMVTAKQYISIPFDPATFGRAALNGKSIGEVNPKSSAHKHVQNLVDQLASSPQSTKTFLSRFFNWR